MDFWRRGFRFSLAASVLLSLTSACKTSESQVASASKKRAQDLRYLAIGDSITFGDNSFIPYTQLTRRNPDSFISYANYIGDDYFEGKYLNISCPGETSGSFLDVKARDNGCQQKIKKLGLKYDYETSQMDEAVRLIQANPQLELITVTLGGNDFFVLQKDCQEKGLKKKQDLQKCLDDGAPENHKAYFANLRTILSKVKEAGFKGKFVALNFYALDYSDEALLKDTKSSNAQLELLMKEQGGAVAKVYEAFEKKSEGGSTCDSGLLIKNPIGFLVPAFRCDVHPSEEGARLLAKLAMDAK